MAIVIEGGISIGGNISITGDVGPGFTISSSDFTSYSGWNNMTVNGTTGFTITGSGQIGRTVYAISGSVDAGFNPTKQTEIVNFYNANGLDKNYTAYMYNATWGPASSPTTSVICLGFFYANPTSCQFFLSPVYTGDNNWQTSGQNIFNNVYAASSGTYNFPITFTLITPIISDPGNWC